MEHKTKHFKDTLPSYCDNISLQKTNSKSKNYFLFGIIVAVFCVVLIFSFITYSKKVKMVLFENAQNQLLEVAYQTRDVLQTKFENAITTMHGYSTAFSKYDDFNQKEVYEILNKEIVRHNFAHMSISYPNGITYYEDGTTVNISNQSYFNRGMIGLSTVTEVIPSPRTQNPVVIYSVPIYRNNKIVGILQAENDLEQLEKSFSISAFDKNYYTYVITNTGQVVLHPQNENSESSLVNIFEYLKQNDNDINKISHDIDNRTSNVNLINVENSQKKFMAYAPLSQVNGWYAISFVNQEPILKQSNYIFTLTIMLLCIILSIIFIIFLYIYIIKRNTHKKFETLANTDSVTNCRSWHKFSIDAEEILRKNREKPYAYIYTNIENFKYLNDILGFEMGNKLLRHIVEILNEQLNKDEAFTRITADRFGILIEYLNDAEIIVRLDHINKLICQFQSLNKIQFEMKIDFGIYKIKDKTLSIATISDRALLAMQTLKNTPDSNYGFYNSSIRQKVITEKELENEMQSALDKKEFVVFLQPKFNLVTQDIIGAEALVRWLHPKKGLIPPNQFIELFETNGFIVKLDYYMFEESCRLLRTWMDNGNNPIPISVNLSRVHLYNPNVAEELFCIALRYNIPTSLIEIELTETMSFDNISMLLGIVNRLKSFNFTISIDDFGTGYSSLHMLKDLPVDILKIDRDFFSNAADEQRGREVIASIIDMAKRLNMKTVAEGVEEKEQADFLCSVNCDFVQGFYFSKPISIFDFEDKYINKQVSFI